MREDDFLAAGLAGAAVPGEEWRYVMLETGKSNYAPQLGNKYFRLVSVDLGNAVVAGGRSDSYGVVEMLQGVAAVTRASISASTLQAVLDKIGQMEKAQKWFRPGIRNSERGHQVFTGESGDPDFQGSRRIADRDTLKKIIFELERAGCISRQTIPSIKTKNRNGNEDGYVVLNGIYVPAGEFKASQDPFTTPPETSQNET
jgi:hypothetical protein